MIVLQQIAFGIGWNIRYKEGNAPVAQLDRVLPSEGKGRTFESSRVRHFPISNNDDVDRVLLMFGQ